MIATLLACTLRRAALPAKLQCPNMVLQPSVVDRARLEGFQRQLARWALSADMLAGVQVAGAAATGLVHISEAADEYVKDLGQLFSPGQSAATFCPAWHCVLCRSTASSGTTMMVDIAPALDPSACHCDEVPQRPLVRQAEGQGLECNIAS